MTQRIIFDVPEETTPAEIISGILKKNNIEEADDFLYGDIQNLKLIITATLAKDFFDKKATEEEIIVSFQNKFKISRENAKKIATDIKQELIPFAKKVEILQSDTQSSEPADKLSKIKPPIGVAEALEKPNAEITEKKIIESPQEKIVAPAPKKRSRLPKKPVPIETPPGQPKRQRSGPDKYREPI